MAAGGVPVKSYIRRDNAIRTAIQVSNYYDGWYCEREEAIKKSMNDIPAEDVMPIIHATLIDWYGDYKCSNCDAEIKSEILYMCDEVNFCPCCGADMRGEKDD